MCKKIDYDNTSNTRMDKCMQKEIKEFNRAIELLSPYMIGPLKIVACCCGHGKYPKTIILREKNETGYSYFEHFSKVEIPRTRRFYKRDSEGFYYIPEVDKLTEAERLELQGEKKEDMLFEIKIKELELMIIELDKAHSEILHKQIKQEKRISDLELQ